MAEAEFAAHHCVKRTPRVCTSAQVLSCQHDEGRKAMREAGEQGNVVSEKQAEHCARALVDEAMQRHSRDNTTVVVMLLSWV